ncbi:MAG TPA: YceH family protein [Pyrinomonadaceae bacterium]
MPTVLNEIEVRVLGSLVEKQVTTPEYYPLSLNALTLACNQKNNRHPVTAYDETTVMQAVESLREKNLAYVFYGSNSRVPKYKHVMPEVMHLSQQEMAVICVLMLRGPQTLGEIKDRGARLYEFSTLEEVDATLNALSIKDPDPMVIRLARQPGQKEARFAHLLSGEVIVEAPLQPEAARRSARASETERLSELEHQLQSLRADVTALQEQFEQFKKQFE